jgi:hypothetical protein
MGWFDRFFSIDMNTLTGNVPMKWFDRLSHLCFFP